jgi:hypothetical protein
MIEDGGRSQQIFFFAGHSSSEDDAARGSIELNQNDSINIETINILKPFKMVEYRPMVA